jgi:predicted membrane-bound spermidine synthase
MNYAISISFWTGLISLAQEILWVRYVSFASQGLPQSFSLVLILYLLGISVGAWIGKKACKKGDDLAIKIRTTLRISAVIDLTFIAALVFIGPLLPMAGKLVIAAVAIVLTAAGKSVIFPMTHQLGSSEGSRLGRSISSVYFANVLGATFGPLFATFVLLALLTLQQALVCLAVLTMICALVLEENFDLKKIAQAVSGLALATVLVFAEPHLMIRALVAKGSDASSPLLHIIESPHGIVHTETSQLGADVVKGGNSYDGLMTLDFNRVQNADRGVFPLVATANPSEVLVIGLSGGAWLAYILQDPRVKKITVIELNPSYRKLIRSYPEIDQAITDNRVTFVDDDARRWLTNNPTSKFNFILMNTTQHWRSYASLLLSKEMMGLLKRALTTDGVVTLNTTQSPDAIYTVKQNFEATRQWGTFIAGGSTSAMRYDEAAAIKTIKSMEFFLKSEPNFQQEILGKLSAYFAGKGDIQIKPMRPTEMITDDNAITEFRYGALTRYFPKFFDALPHFKTDR